MPSEQHSPTEKISSDSTDRVSWNQLIAYGMGGVIPIALFNIAGQLMSLLGNISLGLSAVWLGVIMALPRLWEAFSDPIVGHLSDNTRSRWGRRRPFILFGAIAVALSFVGMWWVPRDEWIQSMFTSEWMQSICQLVYILGGMFMFFTACAIFDIPHGALGMEMSKDYHERTRLFSAKSFFGNFFAMGTPALFLLAGLEFFAGPGGNHIDGMRYVSLLIAIILIPLAIWWFVSLREPGFAIAKEQKKSSFWHEMKITTSNKTFLWLTAIVFTLAMGFNFVSNMGNYITIFYLYRGNTSSQGAGWLMFVIGWVWAVTGLLAVFPLNWISRRLGKNRTLILAILLMCSAQLAKIVCYNPAHPYLILIPTVLLSTGMLMFFTLGSSMVADVCDEDELHTGTRSEGMYCAVFWWFIKVGTSIATVIAGLLLVFTQFDADQNVAVEKVMGNVGVIRADAERWQDESGDVAARQADLEKNLNALLANTDKVKQHFDERSNKLPEQSEHFLGLFKQVEVVRTTTQGLLDNSADSVTKPKELTQAANALMQQVLLLKPQSPITLFRLRLVEIGLPLLLSVISIYLALRYPLTEARCHEIKRELEARHAAATLSS
jgi:GPH family glycoside/pentoside/hexuronide:cation symporter